MKIIGEDENGDLSVKGKNMVTNMDKDIEDERRDLSMKGKNMISDMDKYMEDEIGDSSVKEKNMMTDMNDDMEDEDSYVIAFGSMPEFMSITFISVIQYHLTPRAMYEDTHDMVEEIMKNAILESEKINKEKTLWDQNQGTCNIGERDNDVDDDLNDTTVSQHNIRDQVGSVLSINILDPKVIRAKGSGKRIGRNCRTCHEKGHDSRICSKRKK
ncbi:hypothetical protein HHK36_009387 [Tetracentron sinense]|uniref:Uncharacterized protein n=1 Tax=Tetracentron sinense TaxID=13715 RepID=A0A834ZCT3_TETSI|nr:hypothetical protein HHK36_009387 [Tetracentron sinense]